MKRKWIRNPLIRKIVKVYSPGLPELASNKQEDTAWRFPRGGLVGITVVQMAGGGHIHGVPLWQSTVRHSSVSEIKQASLCLPESLWAARLHTPAGRWLGGHNKLPRELLVFCDSGVGTCHPGPWVQAATAYTNMWCSHRCVWRGGHCLGAGR